MNERESEISDIFKSISLDYLLLEIGDERFPVMVLYDDFEFTQIDFDIIDGSTRNKILRAFDVKGFKIHGARNFTSNKGQNFRFARPSHTLGCNPADKVYEVLSIEVVTFCTPTQAILLMARLGDARLKDADFLKWFLLKLPANIMKIRQWIKQDELKENLPFSVNSLIDWNEEAIKKRRNR